MIVNDFDIVSVSVAPDETNPKLVIDADAMLPGSVTLQRLQAVAWRNPQVFLPVSQNFRVSSLRKPRITEAYYTHRY